MALTRMPAGHYEKRLIRFPQDVLKSLQEEAVRKERSLNGQIVYVLRVWCAAQAKAQTQAQDVPDCASHLLAGV